MHCNWWSNVPQHFLYIILQEITKSLLYPNSERSLKFYEILTIFIFKKAITAKI